MTPADLAAIEARGVQSTDDALVMADAILDDPDGGVEWLMAHGCDALDRLRVEVRRLRALTADRDALAARLASEVAAARSAIYARIEAERVRQDAKWGEQNHPDVDRVLTDRGPSTYHGMTSPGGCSPARMAEEYGIPTESRAKASCDGAARLGQCTWAHIAVEELAEVIHAATLAQQGRGPEEHVDKELVQLAAVVTAWIEARERRAAAYCADALAAPPATTEGA